MSHQPPQHAAPDPWVTERALRTARFWLVPTVVSLTALAPRGGSDAP